MLGKKINNLIPSIVLKSLLYLIGFFNEIGYLRLNNIAHFILLAHAMENFQLALFGLLVLPYCADESAHIADIIGESYAAESFKFKKTERKWPMTKFVRKTLNRP